MLFLHATTHIEGEVNENLFAEKGGGGFPTFLMMDDSGAVIGKHVGERTIPEFEKTVARAVFYLDAKKKFEAGDKVAGIDYAIARLDLGMITADEARKAIEENGTPTKEQQARFDGVLLNAEVNAIAKAADQDRAAAGKQFVELKRAGKIPPGTQEYIVFWDAILQFATAEKSVPLFTEALAKLKEKLGANPNKKAFFQKQEDVLKKMKQGK